MTIYTGVADGFGDFNIPFNTSYSGGQKVVITSDKDGLSKTVSTFAPSIIIGDGVIQLGGSLTAFPFGVTSFKITGITGKLNNHSFFSVNTTNGLYSQPETLIVDEGITEIGNNCFSSWADLTTAYLPSTLTKIGDYAFEQCNLLSSVTVLASSPPILSSSSFINTSASLKIYVPADSVNIYKAAQVWANYASQIFAIV